MGKQNRFEIVYKEDNALVKGLKMILVDKETGEVIEDKVIDLRRAAL